MKKFFVLIFLTFFYLPAFAQTISDNPRIQKIDQILTGLEKEGLNGVILIRSHNELLLHKAYGVADREKSKKVGLETGFCIGSLVKSMTAAGVLRLEEMGKLSTADTLARFFPSVPEDKKNITIAQIMSHTAGMDDMFGSDYEIVTRDWLQDKALGAKLIGEPGAKRVYSNSGYSVLAIIIEKASGKTYEKFIRDEVLKPAGVKRIGYIHAGWKNKDLAVGYYEDKRWGSPLDKKWAKDGPSWNLRGNGGMLSTVEETAAWYEALLEGKVLKPESLKKFLANSSGTSRTLGERVILLAGGNDVFNSIQFSTIDSDFHMTFFTSNAKFEAEKIVAVRDEAFALVKELRK
jgi:CubicO group peptidase (beta-lactamase class C family)